MRLFTQYKGLRRENYILFLGKMVTNLGAMVWPILTMILNQKLGMSATETATFSIVTGFFFLPASLIGGYLADRFNKKMVIICCDIISVALYIVSGMIPLTLFTMCLVMAGAFFQTLENPAYNAIVAEVTPQEKREKAFSLLYLGKNIGLILAPTIAGFLFKNHLSLCFIINGLAISLSTVLITLFVKDTSVSGKKEQHKAMDKKVCDQSIMSVLRGSAALLLFIISMSFHEGAYSQFGYLMPLDISKAYPETGSVIYGTVASVNCIIVVVFTPFITMMLEKVSLSKKFALGTFFQALSFVAFLLSFGVIAGYYVSITLFTIGEILTATVHGAFLSGKVPMELRGRLYGISDFISAVMVGIVKYYSGQLFDTLGLKYAWAFSIAITLIAVIVAFFVVIADKREESLSEEGELKVS